MRKLSHEQLVSRQEVRVPRLPFTVVLNNVRSLYNVGSVFRTADAAGVEKIWLCGITGILPDPKIAKTALGAEKEVPWEFCADARDCVEKLKKEGYQIVLLEQTDKSVFYEDFEPAEKLCLVLGHETGGISESLLDLADAAVEIEMSGLKNSLNVTVAFGIAAYHFRSTFKKRLGIA